MNIYSALALRLGVPSTLQTLHTKPSTVSAARALLHHAGSYLRLEDSCITQRKAQGNFRTCEQGKEAAPQGTLHLKPLLMECRRSVLDPNSYGATSLIRNRPPL